MDPTRQFFTKLKNLAMTLESETSKLQQAFDNRNNAGDSEATGRAMRAYHELNCEVANLKGQIQGQLAQQKAQVNEVNSFIKACRVMEKRVSEDIQVLKGHWEKYGYQAPRETRLPNKAKSQEPEADLEDEHETAISGEEGSPEEAGGQSCSSPSKTGPPPFTDVLRTPQLSDFGLSEMQLKKALAGAEWCSEVPPMPEMNLPQPSLNTPAPPPLPLTPKCALRMDDDELQTPQMHDFGISEHTMCLNNDFTMDLFRKNTEKPQRPSQDIPEPPINSLTEVLQRKDNLESPEPPMICTPGFKIKKTKGRCFSPAQGNSDPESCGCPANLPSTPEVPAFQTPYVKRLVSAKRSAHQTEPINMQTEDNSHTFEFSKAPSNEAGGSKHTWEYSVPELSNMGVEDKQMPEMPNLESVLGNSLQSRNAKIPKTVYLTKEPSIISLELDGPTQEFSLGTPRFRMDYQDPSTPEMPDLSSVTQDICKLVSQAQLKKTSMAVVHPNVRPEKEKNRAVSLSVVSESEFQGLPSYLRQVTLQSLNQTVHSINKFTAECEGEKTELHMEELRMITNVGTKTPVYILCLTELKRLKHIGGVRNTSVYKLCTNN